MWSSKLALLWKDGTLRIKGLIKNTIKNSETNVDEWYALDKIPEEDRVLVGGLDKTTDPYTQVIKLVDSSGKIQASTRFELPGTEFNHAIMSFHFFEGLDAIIGRSNWGLLHLLAVKDDKISVLQTCVRVCRDGAQVIHIVMTEDNKLLVGTLQGLAVVKLISN